MERIKSSFVGEMGGPEWHSFYYIGKHFLLADPGSALPSCVERAVVHDHVTFNLNISLYMENKTGTEGARQYMRGFEGTL